MADSLNAIVDDFAKELLGYVIKLSCLYIP